MISLYDLGYGSLKVTGNGTIRKLGCGFLFVFHSNNGSILCHFRDEARCWSKIAIFWNTTRPFGVKN